MPWFRTLGQTKKQTTVTSSAAPIKNPLMFMA
jgi:hypothetical protein